ncbi:putative RNA-directed DNA polymerase, eukaryota, reverse transcriptase zinc-binding domain protein [Tanacetum coccineum]|uniref:RNA-directed DNA polymerase, eukaryota, reverse transcriptase zinc-binding domain protein n=1 Tax=Tanacetum coccineum TaxID=301880 RepID=A0ABQ5FW18_9ASTR
MIHGIMKEDEAKNAVWDYGRSKDPDPDGFFFAFVKKYWDDIKVDILEYVNIFLGTGSLPRGSNSSFFTLIPKVINHVFIKDFHPISLIGVHYKIIAKILANSLAKVIDKIVSHEQSAFIDGRQILDGHLILNFVLLNLGFVSKWRFWIRAYLSSSRVLVLVNGSPTSEFSINRGLRQGDPLSSFLFILVMVGLHNALSTTVSSSFRRGIKFGSLELNISHIFYVDDVIITTEWNANDLDNIIRVLQVFYFASGLKINIQKSNVHGIGVSDVDISFMASNYGCASGSYPFTYLGLPIGSNMSLHRVGRFYWTSFNRSYLHGRLISFL